MKNLLRIMSVIALSTLLMTACKKHETSNSMNTIDEKTIQSAISAIQEKYGDGAVERAQRSVPQAAALWTSDDGTAEEFKNFCVDNFVADSTALAAMADQLQRNLESLWGCFNKISVDLKLPIHVTGPEPTAMDELFGGFDPSAHFDDDMFEQKIAFIVVLNFPFYTLEEKEQMGAQWSRRQWAYARLGDLFTSRIPAACNQQLANQLAAADNYISNYNIMMGHLRDEKGNTLFPDLALITHWGLRDELKTHYNEGEAGLLKQRMIYQVMLRIIDQSIPQCVINSDQYEWSPYTNTVTQQGKVVKAEAEPLTRYQYFLDNFHAMQQVDRCCPRYPTALDRAFSQDMEVSYDEIEQLFTTFCSSEQVAQVAAVIRQRLGRDLEPFDIWYDGFKSRSSLNEDYLTAITQRLYPTKEAFAAKGMPLILNRLGFAKGKSDFLCSHITVDPSRGAGHAWESNMRSDNARLRTRIGEQGMDYKGYNIAVHEFGHNVEQTITLHDVDNYIMKGVPNTAFTEALAFVFQARDLDFLPGFQAPHSADADALATLDIFWGCYEIMGVALVDMYSWRWLYDHPNATAKQLKEQVMATAQQVWNQYYAPVLGGSDSPILAIYSHMIDSPLYLANYPYGHIIQFQLEQQLRGKSIADEVQRMYPVGRLTPQHWMRHAVGTEVSTQPLLEAAAKAAATLNTEH